GCRSRSSSATGCTTCRKRGSIAGTRGRISGCTSRTASGSPRRTRRRRRHEPGGRHDVGRRRIGRGSHAMFGYVVHRLFIMIPTLFVISVLTFLIIQAPPGDYLSTYIAELQSQGEAVDPAKIAYLRQQYGLDRPFHEQYIRWIAALLQGDMGYSFEHGMPVNQVVGDRLLLTVIVSAATILFIWVVSFPIGIYSATHQYSLGDYGLTFLGYLGLATPNFLL